MEFKLNTKEEIIQYFMNEFDNSEYKEYILKVISKEEIENILNSNINGTNYIKKNSDVVELYNPYIKELIYNEEKIERMKLNSTEKIFMQVLN